MTAQRHRACMLAPRDLADLPGRATGYMIAGAAGASAKIRNLGDRPNPATPVVVWATLTDVYGWPVSDPGTVFAAFTGVTDARQYAGVSAGGWMLTLDPNGDPVTVTPPAAPRRSWRALARRSAAVAFRVSRLAGYMAALALSI